MGVFEEEFVVHVRTHEFVGFEDVAEFVLDEVVVGVDVLLY